MNNIRQFVLVWYFTEFSGSSAVTITNLQAFMKGGDAEEELLALLWSARSSLSDFMPNVPHSNTLFVLLFLICSE